MKLHAKLYSFGYTISDVRNVLGEGCFARCVLGEYQGRAVAVKITKTRLGVDGFKDFLREIKLMAFVGKHDNIVALIGAVVDRISESQCNMFSQIAFCTPTATVLNTSPCLRSTS